MAKERGDQAGAPADRLSTEGLLLRAALLAGYGRRATPLARRLAAVVGATEGRSCLEAGASLQFTVDAPGPAGLRVGLRMGVNFDAAALAGLVPEPRRQQLARTLGPLPDAEHETMGTWLFWTEERQSVFVDLRDPEPANAIRRLSRILDSDQMQQIERLRPALHGSRPWALRVEVDDAGLSRLHLHWLLPRHASPEAAAEAVAPGRWPQAVEALGHLLRRPGLGGRWLIATPLEDRSRPALRIGNGSWALVPEDERKHRAVGQLVGALGGPRDYAEALWSLCRGNAASRWRVGRACELRVTDRALRARLFFAPQTQEGASARINNSAAEDSSTGPSVAKPSRA